jgi:hypothetical protein
MELNYITLPAQANCFHYITAIYLHIHHPDEFKDWNLEMKTSYPITYKARGRPMLNRTKRKLSKLSSEQSKDDSEEDPNAEYEITGVEGLRFSPEDGKSEILVVWKDYYDDDDDGDLVASWAEYDRNLNHELTVVFFQDTLKYLERKKKSTNDQDFTCIERSLEHNNPYVFYFLGTRLHDLPSQQKAKDFFQRFEQNFFRSNVDLLKQSVQTTTSSLSQL